MVIAMKTASELSACLRESMARLRDGQVGCDSRGFVRALRAQLLDEAPEGMRLAIRVRLAAMDKMLDDREAVSSHSGARAVEVEVEDE